MNNCKFCSAKTSSPYEIFCSWDCCVKKAEADGGIKVCPNGLPVMCVRDDNTMLEHEDADHPDYKFPVEAECVKGERETHALIYANRSIAVTMYECCFAMWYLKDGRMGGGSIWTIENWRLTEESIKKINDYMSKNATSNL